MNYLTRGTSLAVFVVAAGMATAGNEAGEPRRKPYPVPAEKLAEINASLDRYLKDLSQEIGGDPENAELYSGRGGVRFLLGRFDEAAADFDREVELDPERLALHWRRGIALYYAGRYEESAAQFARYHAQDKGGDRENGIWHFLANAEGLGIEEARRRMIQYDIADGRPVMNEIYEMYAGNKPAGDVLRSIETTEQHEPSRQLSLFYAHAYIGWLAVAEDDLDRAREHLHTALANELAQGAGGGPGYMWHTARVHYDLLVARGTEAEQK